MGFHTTHRLTTTDRVGRVVTVELQRELDAAPAMVARLPVLNSQEPVRVPWRFSDDLGLGVLTYTLQLDLYDEATPAAPDGMSHLLESSAPGSLRVRVDVAGLGELFGGAPVYGAVQRGLFASRRAVRARFTSASVVPTTVPAAVPAANGDWLRADLLLREALGGATLDGDGEHDVYYAHPWRTQAVWPHQEYVRSALHQVYVPWRRSVGEPWARAVEAVCRATTIRVGRSLTLGRYLVAEALQGWGGAALPAESDGPAGSLVSLSPTALGPVELSGTVSGERVGYVRVGTSQGGLDGDPPGVVRDRLGVVRDAPAEVGAAATGFRAVSLETAYASEFGTSVTGLTPVLHALAGWSGDGSVRALGQVYGLGLGDADACLQLEAALATRVHGWLGAVRQRVSLTARTLLDPMLPVSAELPTGVGGTSGGERVYLPVSGVWHVLGVRTECELVELSGVGEAAPPAPAAWYGMANAGSAQVTSGWERYTPSVTSNRRLASLTVGADVQGSGGAWTPASFRRPGGSVVTAVALGALAAWNGIEPESVSLEFQRSVYVSKTVRWRIERGGAVVWTGEPFTVPA